MHFWNHGNVRFALHIFSFAHVATEPHLERQQRKSSCRQLEQPVVVQSVC